MAFCRWSLWVFPLALTAFDSPVTACSIPVFRYALERWSPSPYEVAIFRRGAMPPQLEEAARRIEDARANFRLSEVDLDRTPNPVLLKLWNTEKARATLPWVMVRYPDAGENPGVLWQGPLSDSTAKWMFDSPARRRVVEALVGGHSAVFVLLSGEDAKQDEATAQVAETELARLRKTIELPMPTADGPQLRSDLPLRVSFPLLRLSRSDPAERVFLATLLGSDAELARVGGPILIPIFGRGRLLCGLHGEDLCPEQIAKVAQFLCGACSCQVKELNPGIDLLLEANWDERLGESGEMEGPLGTAEVRQPLPAAEPRASFDRDDRASPTPAEIGVPWRNYLWLGVGLSSGLVALTAYWFRRSRSG